MEFDMKVLKNMMAHPNEHKMLLHMFAVYRGSWDLALLGEYLKGIHTTHCTECSTPSRKADGHFQILFFTSIH